jgi:hypothetical protein
LVADFGARDPGIKVVQNLERNVMQIRTRNHGIAPSANSPLVAVKQPKGARADQLLSIPVIRKQGRCSDMRVQARSATAAQSARVSWKGAAHGARLINCCDNGAMIEAGFEPELWDRLELVNDNHSTPCNVVWIKQGRIGLQFAGGEQG